MSNALSRFYGLQVFQKIVWKNDLLSRFSLGNKKNHYKFAQVEIKKIIFQYDSGSVTSD